MKDTVCKITFQKSLGGGYFQMGLETGFSSFTPGQFGMLEVPPVEGILLRRPFSFARQRGEVTEILYKVVGRGTASLSQCPEGSSLKLLGPLGKGFSVPSGEGDLVGVAGGYGIAPFLELAAQLKQSGRDMVLFYGARSKEDLFYLSEFKDLKVKVEVATEDGSLGFQGMVTELLANTYLDKKPRWMGSCGPMGLLKAVQEWGKGHGVDCELSVEEAMGCGTGVKLEKPVSNPI